MQTVKMTKAVSAQYNHRKTVFFLFFAAAGAAGCAYRQATLCGKCKSNRKPVQNIDTPRKMTNTHKSGVCIAGCSVDTLVKYAHFGKVRYKSHEASTATAAESQPQYTRFFFGMPRTANRCGKQSTAATVNTAGTAHKPFATDAKEPNVHSKIVTAASGKNAQLVFKFSKTRFCTLFLLRLIRNFFYIKIPQIPTEINPFSKGIGVSAGYGAASAP